MERIRVLLADDQILFVDSLRIVFQTRARDIEVVGVAHDGTEAIELAKRHRPDVVLMDVRMPGMDGVEAARILHELLPRTRVVMLTTFDDDDYVRDALEHGAVGYLLKNMPPDDLIGSIRGVHRGVALLAPEVASKLAAAARQSRAELGDLERVSRAMFWELSAKEREIAQLIAEGWSNQEIADELSIAEQTVKNHISEIYSKLDVHDRAKLILLLRRVREQPT